MYLVKIISYPIGESSSKQALLSYCRISSFSVLYGEFLIIAESSCSHSFIVWFRLCLCHSNPLFSTSVLALSHIFQLIASVIVLSLESMCKNRILIIHVAVLLICCRRLYRIALDLAIMLFPTKHADELSHLMNMCFDSFGICPLLPRSSTSIAVESSCRGEMDIVSFKSALAMAGGQELPSTWPKAWAPHAL